MVRATPRIVIASTGLGHVTRGVEAWAADMFRSLRDSGHDAYLCKGGGQRQSCREFVVPCLQRDSRKALQLHNALPKRGVWRIGLGTPYDIEQSTFAPGLLEQLRSLDADLLHVQDPHLALLMQWASRWRLIRTKTILAHGTNEPFSFQRRITYLQHLAPWHAENAKAEGVWRRTWTVIPNYVDTETFRPGVADEMRHDLGIPRHGTVVLCAAAIKREHKRIDYLLDEFSRFRNMAPDLPVWLVVAGATDACSQELISKGRAELGDRVRFLVNFPRNRMAELYRAANLFVLCSLREMMPVALLEATATGLPCLINRHPILEWMVGPGGMAIDMSAGGVLATALHAVCKDPANLSAIGNQARAHCYDHFSRKQIVSQIDAYYRAVWKSGDRRSPTNVTARLNQSG